ncbi:hypothetical protein [Streptomyces prasinopilosus]|uniref:Uncharacterized protein n=1 Tax=Streptomyces prasinopilosus TaxID=67344 RepID=A0A1G6R6H5_9ACTN|nr:hypothetical protein [Streptomyces prasinopilosus]SDC99637.1 hypothetical protein SAMN05216505_104385 [Streptomyces prasinopilosus]
MITGLDHAQRAAPPGSEERPRAYHLDVPGTQEAPKPPSPAA